MPKCTQKCQQIFFSRSGWSSTSHILWNIDIGPVAQRIRRLTTDQEIAGSNPAGIEISFYFKANGMYFFKLKHLIYICEVFVFPVAAYTGNPTRTRAFVVGFCFFVDTM